MGSGVPRIGQTDSRVQGIAKAVSWLRANFDQPVNIEDVAKLVNMSVTSFHRQFKAVTGMSPLQYQKSLRLQRSAAPDARRNARRRTREPPRRLLQRFAIHARVQALLRKRADDRHRSL